MAQEMSVKAVMSAVDRGFLSFMKKASGGADSLSSSFASGLSLGIFGGIGYKVLNTFTSQISGLVSEINDTNSAWKSFSDNMAMSGMKSKQIKNIQTELQDFARDTVYSSKDMASTYAQLYAVNKKTSTALVKGFGAVAAAAENPTQAMKTLSTQATQMAAKPTVAWQDFKLMLEQTPAGIAKVAKQMGMSTAELVSSVQDGKVATKDFFKAIEELSEDESLMNMAMQYKTIGAAMDGLRATLASKLAPAFDIASKAAISFVSGAMTYVATRMNMLSDSFGKLKVGETWTKAFKSIGKALGEITGSAENLDSFQDFADAAAKAINRLGQFCDKHAAAIARFITLLPKLVKAFIAFKAISFVSGKISELSGAIGALSGKTAVVSTVSETGEAAGKKLAAGAKGFVAFGAGVLLAAGGIWLISNAAIGLAEAGPLAIGVMVGLVAIMAGLAAGAAAIGEALTLGAVGFVAFGAAVLLVGAGLALAGAGVWLVCNGLTQLATVLPIVAAVGCQAALALMSLGGGLTVFSAGAGVALLGCTALFGGCVLLAAGFVLLAGGVALVAVGVVALALALRGVNSSMKSIASNAKSAAASLTGMVAAVNIVNSGLSAIGNKARAAMSALKSAFSNAAGAARGYGLQVGNNFSSGIKSGLNAAKNTAYTSGAFIGIGLANGMLSQLSRVRAAAAKLAAAADKAIQAKAKIGSPSRVAAKNGNWIAIGLANGMEDKIGKVKAASASLFDSMSGFNNHALAGDVGMALSEDYNYSQRAEYNITVVSEIDGKEVARTTAPHMEKELDARQTRADRRKGKK